MNHFKGLYQTEPIEIKRAGVKYNIQNLFTFNKGWGAEISGFQQSRSSFGIIGVKGFYMVAAAVYNSILERKWHS